MSTPLPPGVTFELVPEPWPELDDASSGSAAAQVSAGPNYITSRYGDQAPLVFDYTPHWYRAAAGRSFQLDALLASRVLRPGPLCLVTGV